MEKNESLITVKNLEDCLSNIFMKSIRKINACEKRINKAVNEMKSKSLEFGKMRKTLNDGLKKYSDKLDGIEETFFILYHNIKKNQFLFVTEPESWYQNYLDLKEHYKEENEDDFEKPANILEDLVSKIMSEDSQAINKWMLDFLLNDKL